MRDAKEVSDELAADALQNGSKSGKVPTHTAMENAADDEDATDISEDDDYDFDEDKERY